MVPGIMAAGWFALGGFERETGELGAAGGVEGCGGRTEEGCTEEGGGVVPARIGDVGPAELDARRSSSESAGSPTTCSAASSTPRTRAMSLG